MSLKEYVDSVESEDNIKNEVYKFLVEQGISLPSDLGFLANAKGEVSEGVVRCGCPGTDTV